MKVAVAGSSGLIGSGLVPYLRQNGHTVVRLVRHTPSQSDEIQFLASKATIDVEAMTGIDAVINLAGTGVADEVWTEDRKRSLLTSRLDTTELLATTMAAMVDKPKVFIQGTAIGWYGYESGDKTFVEGDPAGNGFLAEMCQAWEKATLAASNAGIRVVLARTGVVLSTAGGALAKQVRPFRLGLGGRIGTGSQYLSWISLADEVAALTHCLNDDRIVGPVNLTAPTPVTNQEFTKALGSQLHRPTLLPTPLLALRILFGAEAVKELFAGGQRVIPGVLGGTGFTWRHVNIDEALAELL